MPRERPPATVVDDFLKEVDLLVSQIETDSKKLLFEGSDLGFEEAETEVSCDGACEIRVSEDKMEVTADFVPARGLGRPLSVEQFQERLREKGVVHGVSTTLGGLVGHHVVVASGTAAVDAMREGLEVLSTLRGHRLALDEKALSLDFKTHSPFVQVHDQDLLAHRIPAQVGIAGRDVEGHTVPFGQGHRLDPKPGKNVVATVGGYRAVGDGNFQVANGQFWVDRVLVLNSGVGYETGHIDFEGDVLIEGEVAAGFIINIQGSLFSNGPLDVTEIVCGGNVVTPGGIIGRAGSSLRAGGQVRARFLENASVVAHGSLEILAGVMKSHLQTLDKVIMGPRGLILGGKVEAQNGIDVFQVGNSQGIRTELVCGLDFTVLEKMEWARTQSTSLVRQLKTLETHRLAHPAQGKLLDAACSRVRNQVLKLNEMSRRLVSGVDANDQASVTVRGMVYGGTSIEICHVTLNVVRPLSRVRFSLDKSRGVIREEHL